MDADEIRRGWAERSGEFSPDYYAYYGPNDTSELIRRLLDGTVGPDATVLELGCSSGRHLSHLHDNGYGRLHGVEINENAFDVMERAYPELAAAGTFHCDAIESVVRGFDDGEFDVVYSVETLQHLPPDSEWVFGELARIAGELLVTVENEGEDAGDGEGEGAGDDVRHPADEPAVNYINGEFPLYYRRWDRVFARYGLVEVDSRVLERDTLRVFRPAGHDDGASP